jgi:hypothetical protein
MRQRTVYKRAGVAQLVEHRTCNARVGGSNPFAGSMRWQNISPELTTMPCLYCQGITKRKGYKYCSNKCQGNYQYEEYIRKWKASLVDGNRGKKAVLLSHHIRRYLLEKYREKCCLCGWDKRHHVTGRVPLEVNHIDGNPLNNNEWNLQLICPNCHSLTANFRNLNKGNGRAYRRSAALQEAALNTNRS